MGFDNYNNKQHVEGPITVQNHANKLYIMLFLNLKQVFEDSLSSQLLIMHSTHSTGHKVIIIKHTKQKKIKVFKKNSAYFLYYHPKIYKILEIIFTFTFSESFLKYSQNLFRFNVMVKMINVFSHLGNGP